MHRRSYEDNRSRVASSGPERTALLAKPGHGLADPRFCRRRRPPPPEDRRRLTDSLYGLKPHSASCEDISSTKRTTHATHPPDILPAQYRGYGSWSHHPPYVSSAAARLARISFASPTRKAQVADRDSWRPTTGARRRRNLFLSLTVASRRLRPRPASAMCAPAPAAHGARHPT